MTGAFPVFTVRMAQDFLFLQQFYYIVFIEYFLNKLKYS